MKYESELNQMHLRCRILAVFVLSLFGITAKGQAIIASQRETFSANRSISLGEPVDHPEALSGIWETADGEGGAVGIQLKFATALSGDADPPVWSPQTLQHLSVGVFQRKGNEIAFGEENYFSNSPRDLLFPLSLEKGRLRVHMTSSREGFPSVDLDLIAEPNGCWHGRFHRGSFDSAVTLCRPNAGSNISSYPLVGTWSDNWFGCIHVFATSPGVLTGWSDSLQVPGRIRFSPNSPRPHMLHQSYGSLMKVELHDDGVVSLQFDINGAGCCSQRFNGKLSSNGGILMGTYAPLGPNQSAPAATWTKVSGDSCVDSAQFRSSTRSEPAR